MIELRGDLWSNFADSRKIVRCITTNGTIKRDGQAVMGRGCAREAAARYPDLPARLGRHLSEHGNTVGGIFTMRDRSYLLTFPVKHHWMEDADPDLIVTSAQSLRIFADVPDTVFILPRPGCGNGRLNWERVRPLLSFLPDNVIVIAK